MIHLFRKIRRDLIEEKRLNKYLLYAFGEIVLVMVGILLALYFNKIATEKESNKKANWYLVNIAEDINYQKEDLNYLKEDLEISIATGKSLIKDYNIYKDFTKIDSLNAKLNLLTLSYYFPDIKNTYQELVATGQLSLIEDLDITTRIIDFYLFTNDNAITFTKNNDNVFYKQVSPFLNQLIHVNLDESFLEDDELNLLEVDNNITNYINIELQKPKNKLTLLNAIKTNILIQEGNYYLIEETLILGNELTKQIDKELDSIN